MKLESRLKFSAIVSVAIAILMFIFIVYAHSEFVGNVNQQQIMGEMVNQAFMLEELAGNYYFYGTPRALEQWNMAYESLGDNMLRLDMESATAIHADYVKIQELFSLLSSVDEVHRRRVFNLLSIREQELVRQLLLRETQIERNVLMAEKVLSTILYLSLVSLVGLIIWNAYIIRTHVLHPIKEFTEATREIKKGNLDKRIGKTYEGEFGTLKSTFNRMMDAMQKTQHDYEDLEYAKTQFISITSHELRSPLTVMKGQLQLLFKGVYGTLSDEQIESLEKVLRNTDQLDRIIQDLLDLSSIESSRIEFDFQTIDAKEVIKELAQEMYMINGSSILVNAPSISMKTDRMRLEQILHNLLSNALKFSKKDGMISIEAKDRGNEVLFSVKDEGIGIRHPERIFEPFYQEERSLQRTHHGTGLGLSIVKALVEAMRGEIWVESSPGKGSTFYFVLPKRIRRAKKVSVF